MIRSDHLKEFKESLNNIKNKLKESNAGDELQTDKIPELEELLNSDLSLTQKLYTAYELGGGKPTGNIDYLIDMVWENDISIEEAIYEAYNIEDFALV